MSEETDYDKLMEKARNCRNNARAEQLVVDGFEDEYVVGLANAENPPTPEMNRHMRETYDFYIGGQRRAKAFLEDAALFERVAEIVRSQTPSG